MTEVDIRNENLKKETEEKRENISQNTENAEVNHEVENISQNLEENKANEENNTQVISKVENFSQKIEINPEVKLEIKEEHINENIPEVNPEVNPPVVDPEVNPPVIPEVNPHVDVPDHELADMALIDPNLSLATNVFNYFSGKTKRLKAAKIKYVLISGTWTLIQTFEAYDGVQIIKERPLHSRDTIVQAYYELVLGYFLAR